MKTESNHNDDDNDSWSPWNRPILIQMTTTTTSQKRFIYLIENTNLENLHCNAMQFNISYETDKDYRRGNRAVVIQQDPQG